MSSERLASHEGAGNRSVQVEIPNIKLFPRQRKIGWIPGIDASRQRIGGSVGQIQRRLPASLPARSRRFLPAPADDGTPRQ